MIEVTQALLDVLNSGERAALATVVRTSGSTPQTPGARLMLRANGDLVGTVGGGAIEHAVIDALRGCLRDHKPRTIVWDLGRDLAMCCGGRMEVFVEPIEASAKLYIFGAGHVAKPTAALAQTVGFHVTVIDDREELNTEERFPGCARLRAEPVEAAEQLALSNNDWVLIVTHDHHLDEEALDVFARGPHRYIGMIGSRRKVFRVLHRIHARRGLPPLEKVYAPVGLDIGGTSPEEIAVSVVSELIAIRHGKGAQHMRAVDDPRLRKVLEGQLTPEAAALE